jgi:hypothetical protein
MASQEPEEVVSMATASQGEKKFRQRGGLLADTIPAVDLFPVEWRPKDADEDEEDQV